MDKLSLRRTVRRILAEFTVDLGNGKILQIPDERLSELPDLLGIEPMDKDIIAATSEKTGGMLRHEFYNSRLTDIDSWPDDWDFTYQDILSKIGDDKPKNAENVKKAVAALVKEKSGNSIATKSIKPTLGQEGYDELLSSFKFPSKAEYSKKGKAVSFMAPKDGDASTVQAIPAVKNWISSLESTEEGKSVLEKHEKKLNKLYGGMTYLLTNYGSDNIAMILDSIFVQNQTPSKADSILENLFSVPVSSLFTGFSVPEPLLGLAKTKNESRGGRTGAGEFLLPFVFSDADVQVSPVVLNSESGGGGTANAEFDIFINNAPYHVKAIETATKTAPLGKQSWGKGRPSKSADFLRLAKKHGIGDPTAEFTKQDAIISLAQDPEIGKVLADMSGEPIELAETMPLDILQQIADEDMRTLGMGDSAGVIFYIESDDKFEYVAKDDLRSQNASQSAHRIGLENKNPFFSKLQKSVDKKLYGEVRKLVSNILKEELTRSDKSDIERIAKKQAKKHFDKEIERAIDTELKKTFLGTRGKINKHVDDAITSRFKNADKNKDFDDSVIRVAKRVLRAMNDLHYKRSNLIDKMNVPRKN